jgi:hypothetical protein
MSKRPPLTLREARRAIYLDFEGRKEEEPAVLGTLLGSLRRKGLLASVRVRQAPRAIEAPGRRRVIAAGGAQVLDPSMPGSEPPARGMSTHEVKKVRDHAPELADDFAVLCRDVKQVAKAWRSRSHPELRPDPDGWGPHHRLALYAVWTGCQNQLPEKRIGDTIGKLRVAFSNGRSYADLNERLQARWLELLEQNLNDCAQTRCVALGVLGGGSGPSAP